MSETNIEKELKRIADEFTSDPEGYRQKVRAGFEQSPSPAAMDAEAVERAVNACVEFVQSLVAPAAIEQFARVVMETASQPFFANMTAEERRAYIDQAFNVKGESCQKQVTELDTIA